jgi:hypothetical protein
MKPILMPVCLVACMASHSFAQSGIEEETTTSTITVALTLTYQDEAKFKQSKSEEDHNQAIESNKDSSRTESWGTSTLRYGNREILTAMGLPGGISGWALVDVEIYTPSLEISGLHAQKGQNYIPVPPELLSIGLTEHNIDSGSFKSKYSAKTRTENSSGSGKGTEGRWAEVLGVEVYGLNKYSWKDAATFIDYGSVSIWKSNFSESGTSSVVGSNSSEYDGWGSGYYYEDDSSYSSEPDFFIEGKISYSRKGTLFYSWSND